MSWLFKLFFQMLRFRYISLIIVLSILVLVLASPVLIGWFTERQLQYQTLPLLPGIELKVDEFERGWLSSQFNSHLITPDVQLHLRQQLEHGPLPLTWQEFAAAGLETVLPLSECFKLNLECTLEPIRLHSLIQWDGSSQHQLNITTLTAQNLQLQDFAARFVLPDWFVAGGSHSLTPSEPAVFALRADNFQYSDLNLQEIRAEFNATSAEYLLAVNSQLHIDQIHWEQQSAQQLSLAIQAERLDAILLMTVLEQPLTFNLHSAQHMLAIQNWLASQPRIQINQLQLKKPYLNAQGYIQLGKFQLRYLWWGFDWRNLLQGIITEAELSLDIDQTLAEYLLTFWQPDLTPAQMRQQWQHWIDTGFVSRQQNEYYVRLRYSNNVTSSQL